MRKNKFIVIVIAATTFFAAIIPIIINEVYKYGSLHGGYVTIWDATDVLSYYGTILGAAATAMTIAVTITFTYKQIRRDSYLKNENDKWAKIEFVFANALNEINPMRPLIETMETGLTNPSAAIITIQKYQVSCRIAKDPLNACLNIVDYPKVKPLIDAIDTFREEIDHAFRDEIKEYSRLRDFKGRDNAEKTIKMESKYPNSFPKEDIVFSQKILKSTNGIQLDDIRKAINQVNERIIAIYYGTYRPLLQLKGSTFEIINTEIQKNADSILHLWGRK